MARSNNSRENFIAMGLEFATSISMGKANGKRMSRFLNQLEVQKIGNSAHGYDLFCPPRNVDKVRKLVSLNMKASYEELQANLSKILNHISF